MDAIDQWIATAAIFGSLFGGMSAYLYRNWAKRVGLVFAVLVILLGTALFIHHRDTVNPEHGWGKIAIESISGLAVTLAASFLGATFAFRLNREFTVRMWEEELQQRRSDRSAASSERRQILGEERRDRETERAEERDRGYRIDALLRVEAKLLALFDRVDPWPGAVIEQELAIREIRRLAQRTGSRDLVFLIDQVIACAKSYQYVIEGRDTAGQAPALEAFRSRVEELDNRVQLWLSHFVAGGPKPVDYPLPENYEAWVYGDDGLAPALSGFRRIRFSPYH